MSAADTSSSIVWPMQISAIQGFITLNLAMQRYFVTSRSHRFLSVQSTCIHDYVISIAVSVFTVLSP